MKLSAYVPPPLHAEELPVGYEEFESFNDIVKYPGIAPGFVDRTHWTLYGRLDARAGEYMPESFHFMAGHWNSTSSPAKQQPGMSSYRLHAPQCAYPKRIVFVLNSLSDTDRRGLFRECWFEFLLLNKIYARGPLSRHAMIGRKSGVLEPACEHYAWEFTYPHVIPPMMDFDLRLFCRKPFRVAEDFELWGFIEGDLDRAVF